MMPDSPYFITSFLSGVIILSLLIFTTLAQ
jgi:hypothetical protein